VVMSGSKNIHRKGHVLKRDWTPCSKLLIIPGSIVNIIVGGGGPYAHLLSMRTIALITNKILI
jgi:hypothetical protein